MQKIKLGLLIIFSFSLSFSELSERDILMRALSHNTNIKLSFSKYSSDSLSLYSAKTEWLPKLQFSLQPELTLLDTTMSLETRNQIDSLESYKNSSPDFLKDSINFLIDNLRDYLDHDPSGMIKNKFQISQPVYGGGVLSATFSNSSNKFFDKQLSDYANAFELSFSQPLLNSAGKYSNPQYTVAIQSIENKQVSLEVKKSILSSLSDIRSLYWDYYAQYLYNSTYKREVDRASELMKISRSRFSLGEVSALDTLSASYDLTTAQQKLLDSEISTRKARNKLALELSITPDSISFSDTISITLSDPPEPDTLIALAKEYDHTVKIFEKISEKLLLEKKKLSNDLLPSLSTYGSLVFNRSGDSFFSDDNFSKNGVIGLIFSYSLPLAKSKISRKKTEMDIDNNSIQQKQYLQELQVRLTELKESWDQEMERISLASKSNQLANLQYEAAKKEYSLGTIEKITLLDAQDKLVDSEIALSKMRVDMKKIEIIFDEITGTTFKKFNISLDLY